MSRAGLLLKASIVALALVLGFAPRPAAEEGDVTLAQALEVLAKDAGFRLDLSPAARDLPMPSGAADADTPSLATLLRGTSHLVVRDDEGQILRVIVLGAATPDLETGLEPETAVADADLPATDAVPPPDIFTAERQLVLDGLAPDTEEPTGLAANIRRALPVLERERAMAWRGFVAAAP